jgi:zinc finger HIT domain-containing protein 1
VTAVQWNLELELGIIAIMPLIEELPVAASNTRASYGWTYVADNAAQVPAAQLTSRKRGREGNTALSAQATHKQSAKHQKAIQQRLNDLNKENHRDANIPIPRREGGRAGKERKVTQNVRRILAYSRTFQHYLADEEAGVNVYGAAANVPSAQGQAGRADPRRKSAAGEAVAAQKPGPRRAGSLKQSLSRQIASTPVKAEDIQDGDATMADAPDSSKLPSHPAEAKPELSQSDTTTQQAYDPALDRDPLLRTTDMPKMPSARLMQALLSEPPLSYTAARAKPLDDSQVPGRTGNNVLAAKPPRYFCSICGYWGKVRCKRGCGERVCGLLECYRDHEAGCSLLTY